jgi:hypothetical protein
VDDQPGRPAESRVPLETAVGLLKRRDVCERIARICAGAGEHAMLLAAGILQAVELSCAPEADDYLRSMADRISRELAEASVQLGTVQAFLAATDTPADTRPPIAVRTRGELVGRLIGMQISCFEASNIADLDEGDQYAIDLGNHACGGRALDGPPHDLWTIAVTGGWWLLLPVPGGDGPNALPAGTLSQRQLRRRGHCVILGLR